MEKKPTSVLAKKPKGLLQQQLSINYKELAVALAKAVGHTFAGKFDDLISDGTDAFAALGLEVDSPSALLYLLLERSMQSSLSSLLADSREYLPANYNTEKLSELINVEFSNIHVDQNFFINPNQLPIVLSVSQAIQGWLESEGVNSQVSKTIAQRFPGYFPHALHKEWQSNSIHYDKITVHLDTPFAKASERATAWKAYAARLEQMLDVSVFDEPYGLRQVYIRLNGYYEEENSEVGGDLDDPMKSIRSRVVVDLENELDDWLINKDKDDAIRAISGGPGSGKSSFAKIYAAHVARQGKFKVLFCPLHLIDPTKDFSDEIGKFVLEQEILKYNPLSPDNAEIDLLIILDGLDELASQGKAAEATARDFIRAVQQTTNRRNSQELRLRIIFCGREVVMQEGQSEFRTERQLLNILPYFMDDEEQSSGLEYFYKDPNELLSKDLRDEWWINYGKITGRSFESMPKELYRLDLLEITRQPLLGYLLALSYCRGKLNFSSEVNLNQIYYDLVEAVYERGYENGRKHISVQGMRKNDFFQMLEEIGLAAWHGDGRTTTVAEIESQCRAGGLEHQLKIFKDGARHGITRLLAAFFFRQHGERTLGDPTFVFTHKSFGEYLAARRLVHAIEEMVEERERRIDKGGNKGWNEVDALYHWIRWCGPTALTPYIYKFLVSEISLYNLDVVEKWQMHLSELFSYNLNNCMPMEMVQLPSFQQALFQSRNAEESLLASLNACAQRTNKISELNPESKNTIGTWIKRIQPQRVDLNSCLALKCLSWLDLKDSVFHSADLMNSNLSNSDLRRSIGIGVDFSKAILDKANLSDAYFCSSKFNESSLVGCDLRNSNLDRSNLIGVDLNNANITKASLSKCNLTNANLSNSNCTEVKFTNSILTYAKMVNVNLSKANLEGVIMIHANLSKTDAARAFFLNAMAENANFSECNLSSANFKNANIKFVNFSYANFTRADLRLANIANANFSYASFNGIITENIDLKKLAAQDIN